MTIHNFKDLLDKYANGQTTPDEEQLILHWYNQIGEDIDDELKEEYRVVLEAKLWHRLKNQVQGSKPKVFYWQKIAAAVTILMLVGVSLWVASRELKSRVTAHNEVLTLHEAGMVRIINADQMPRTIPLLDGSIVTLQPESELSYPEVFAQNREVYLKGEAFFDVKRDTLHPFLVYSNEVVTRVLGTSFTIKAYSDATNITVAVKTGRVSVYKLQPGRSSLEMNAKEEVILIPNQQAVYDRGSNQVLKQLIEKPQIVLANPTLFEMKYEGAPVVKIFEVLEENYGIDIDFDEAVLSNCKLTTSLIEEGMFERINIICEAIGAHYEVLGTTIKIKSDGCQ